MKPSNKHLLGTLLRLAPVDGNPDYRPRITENVRILQETRNAVLIEERDGTRRWMWRDEITIFRVEDDRDE